MRKSQKIMNKTTYLQKKHEKNIYPSPLLVNERKQDLQIDK